MSPRARRVARSARAGIIFPVARVHRLLKSGPSAAKRVTQGASVYASAVIEYLVAELLELSGNAAKDNRRSRIIPRHVFLAYANDNELHDLLRKCVLPQSGVLPAINYALLPKITGKTASHVTVPKPSTSRATKKTAPSASKAATTPKPALTKKGQGSFSVLGAPTSKAVALKNTAVTTLSERVLVHGQKLTVVQGSIVNIQADAIVHPTNNKFYMGGDVGKALSAVGGQQLRDAVAQAATHDALTNYGDVILSPAPNLSASHLIHVHSPKWNAASQDECIGDLDKATLNILTLADQQGLTSVAIPSVSSGHAGFPKQTAAQTILAALSKYFRQTATTNLQQVFFVLYDAESVNVYTTELQRMVE